MEYTGRIVFLSDKELVVKKHSLNYKAFTMSDQLSENVNKYCKLHDKVLVETRADDTTIAKAVVLKERA